MIRLKNDQLIILFLISEGSPTKHCKEHKGTRDPFAIRVRTTYLSSVKLSGYTDSLMNVK